MDLSEVPDAFDTHQLWRRSIFAREDLISEPDQESTLFPSLQLDINAIKIDNPYAPTKGLEHDLRLPELDVFQFGPLEDLESIHESTLSLDTEKLPPEPESDENLWKIALDLGPTSKDVKFNTWEEFEMSGHRERTPAYISEAGPATFDAVLEAKFAAEGKSKDQAKVLHSEKLLNSLVNAALGRSSVLLRYEPEKNTFIPVVEGGKMSGCTLDSFQSSVRICSTGGENFIFLRDYAEKTYASDSSLPTQIALATAVAAIVSTLEDYLGKHLPSIQSLLQLQKVYDKPHRILAVMREIVQYAKAGRTNEDLVTRLYLKVQVIEHENEWLRAVLLEILSRVSKPWLEFAENWTGLNGIAASALSPDRLKDTFVDVEETSEDAIDSPAVTNYSYKPERMPAFISEDEGIMVFETGKSLRFLESHHAEHPLVAQRRYGIEGLRLDWKHDWQAMENVANKAKEYEKNLMDAIREFRLGNKNVPKAQSDPERLEQSTSIQGLTDDFERYLSETAEMFDSKPEPLPDKSLDDISDLVISCLHCDSDGESMNTSFAPPVSITASLTLTPCFATQARLVNATTLRLFFRSHGLRHHLSLQRQYHLFGDGVFMSRLTSALFSPELETAERRRGIVRTGAPMGLKLGTRSAWPPASSELRLALMGVLSESYHASQLYLSSKKNKNVSGAEDDDLGIRESPNLPGNLSFAIRTLSPEDADKCMDPNSLYALDFLRLQYTAPPPLHLIITSSALEKYDQVFKLLLRIARMLFVVSHQLPREGVDGIPESKAFRLEAHHFVHLIAAYVFDTGIDEAWNSFSSSLDSLEHRLHCEDDAERFGQLVTEGLESVRIAHESCLDGILFALFLRRRQAQVMKLLEDVFEAVLGFAKVAATANHLTKFEDAILVKELYTSFKSKIGVFISVCRGLAGKRGYAKGQAAISGLFGGKRPAEENTVERLLLKLEMNGYFSQPAQPS
ncbi:hypothetical protein K490DRAFT_36786 [Saccharata proteae CBS 121410]|uniref:Spindle pole body component n=1 Tax=Saccharata proteae CBS 121410 TaxID=1314787 RepID=A0A6A5YFW0_9PEZI|nr:hypothetical protein K490DRAFT_36786 [Saccharata proteae CBS 121410]